MWPIVRIGGPFGVHAVGFVMPSLFANRQSADELSRPIRVFSPVP
jgi:hypothetical protein